MIYNTCCSRESKLSNDVWSTTRDVMRWLCYGLKAEYCILWHVVSSSTVELKNVEVCLIRFIFPSFYLIACSVDCYMNIPCMQVTVNTRHNLHMRQMAAVYCVIRFPYNVNNIIMLSSALLNNYSYIRSPSGASADDLEIAHECRKTTPHNCRGKSQK